MGKEFRPLKPVGNRPLQVRVMALHGRPLDVVHRTTATGAASRSWKDHCPKRSRKKAPSDDACSPAMPQLAVRLPRRNIPPGRRTQDPAWMHRDPAGALSIRFQLRQKPFSDERVRQAFNLAMDRESIVKNIYQGRALVCEVEHVCRRSPPAISRSHRTYDTEKAKKLLADAGFPNGSEGQVHQPQGRYPRTSRWPRRAPAQWKSQYPT